MIAAGEWHAYNDSTNFHDCGPILLLLKRKYINPPSLHCVVSYDVNKDLPSLDLCEYWPVAWANVYLP